MLDTGPCKQYFKDASPEECKAMYAWITGAMEVRGLMPIAFGGGRKRRSDAGKTRGDVQPSLSGLPDENEVGS